MQIRDMLIVSGHEAGGGARSAAAFISPML
jgi:hypothetical protein